MAAGGMLRVIYVVVVELLFDDVLVIFLFFLFLFTVTRTGPVGHGLLMMRGIVSIGLTGGGVGVGGDDGSVEGNGERLVILGIVHDFWWPM